MRTAHLHVKGYLISKSDRDIKCYKLVPHINIGIKHLNKNLKWHSAQILKGFDPDKNSFYFRANCLLSVRENRKCRKGKWIWPSIVPLPEIHIANIWYNLVYVLSD